MRLSESPWATAATVAMLQGTIAMPSVGVDPLAIGARRSPGAKYRKPSKSFQRSNAEPKDSSTSSSQTIRAAEDADATTGTSRPNSSSIRDLAMTAPLPPVMPTTTGCFLRSSIRHRV